MSWRILEDIKRVFGAVGRIHAQALYILDDAMSIAHRGTLIRMSGKARLPTVDGYSVCVNDGGLISYGPSFADMFRRAAGYVHNILKGASPSNLPIEQASKFELVVNMAANALGIAMPQSILLHADEVIR